MIDRVAALIREVSAAVIEPRFTALREGEVEHKSPGELVTVADREAEAALTAGLGRITPGVPVVGEEAGATDPSRLDALRGTDRVWVVDPLDGTGNFVAGSPEWAVMVALIEGGSAVASWIWQPVTLRMFIAERGSGATANGAMLRVRDRGQGGLRGAVLTRFLDPATAATVDRNIGRIEEVVPGRLCSGYEYPAIIEGEADFVLFWRTLPWDHAPGCLLLEEAGGVARRPDGTVYQPGADGVGLLVASGPERWERARAALFD